MSVTTTEGAVLFEGAVLGGKTHRVVRVMSDVWGDAWSCTVWHDGAIRELQLYPGDEAVVDATDAVREAAAAYAAEAHRLSSAVSEAYQRVFDLEDRRTTFQRGDRVRVVRGRKLPIGTVAEVSWAGQTAYGKAVTLYVDGVRHYVSWDNIRHADDDPATLEQARAALSAAESERNAFRAAHGELCIGTTQFVGKREGYPVIY